MDTLSLIILGGYTLIYILVFIYQNNQIKSQKSLIESMKNFTEMFNVDQFRKFQEMKEETTLGKVDLMLKNDERLKEFITSHSMDLLKILKEENDKKLESQMFQLTGVTLHSLHQNLPVENREEFIKKRLPDCEFLIPLLKIDCLISW